MDALREHGDHMQRQVSGQRGELDGLTERVGTTEKRMNALDKALKETTDQVVWQHNSLAARVDAIQHEMYSRISATVPVAQQITGSGTHVDTLSSVFSAPSLSTSRSKTHAKLTLYDGKVSFPTYQSQFEVVAKINGWSDSDKGMYLATALQGNALSVLNTLPNSDRSDYVKLCAALCDRFNHNRSAELSRARLDNRVRRSNETLQAYSSDIEQLILFTYPSLPSDARDTLAKERFLAGLDSELRRQIKLQRPSTYVETVTAAHEVEAILMNDLDADRDRSSRRRSVRNINTDADMDDDADGTVCNVNVRDSAVPKGVLCWTCDKRGHMSRECPTRGTSSGKSERRNRDSKRNRSRNNSRKQQSKDSGCSSNNSVSTAERDETRDETIARLRAELDKLTTSDAKN
jgi:hypothetical protein